MLPHVIAFALAAVPPDAPSADRAAPPRSTTTVHGMGGPLVGVTQLGNGAAMLTGGRGGVLLDRTWFVGLDVEGTPTFQGFQSSLKNGRTIGFWQVAGLAEVSLADHARVHPRLGLALGGALVGTDGPSGGAGTFAFVAEPTGTLEVTVNRFLRLGATAGYRFAIPTTKLVSFGDASGVVAGLSVQIGFVD